MKFMLLIQQGSSPTPRDPQAWARLSEAEQQAVFADYKAISETAGVSSGVQMQPPDTATTVAPAATSSAPGVIVLNDQHQNRTIAGVAYWFPHQGNVSTAILFDYDGQTFDNITTPPTKTIFLHGLINF